jgi:hypothetical protein
MYAFYGKAKWFTTDPEFVMMWRLREGLSLRE